MIEASSAPITAEEVERWRGHIGRRETRGQVLDVESLRRYAAAVGAPLDVEREAPPLAHWAYFLDTVGAEGLGPDGHPKRGGLIPPISLPRRMFAASEMRFHRPLILGRAAEMTLSVTDVRHRHGKGGDLVFVDLERRLRQEEEERVVERQTIAYRAAGAPVASVVPAAPPAAPTAEGEIWVPGPVDLFRFSAATFNAHRIHYDLPYAEAVEHYPGLVVHGPLVAARLFARARAACAGSVAAFDFRLHAPLFVGQPIILDRGSVAGEWHAVRCDGAIAMTARVRLVDADHGGGV
jgi:3-methylfumaryl-CoA hydratase